MTWQDRTDPSEQTPRAVVLPPDPLSHPEYYDGVPLKRVFAYLIDVVLIAILVGVVAVGFIVLGILSFGLLLPVLWPLLGLVPIAYHTLLIGGPDGATLGQRWMGLEVRSITGARPNYLQAFIQTALFYVSVALTSFLILLVVIFTDRNRAVHDFLAGTVVVNRRTV